MTQTEYYRTLALKNLALSMAEQLDTLLGHGDLVAFDLTTYTATEYIVTMARVMEPCETKKVVDKLR